MIEKIKISAVSYLNTKPFLKGFEKSNYKHLFEIHLDYPAESANKLIQNKVDIALIPVVVLPQIKTPHIISNFGIGALGKVKTVCLFSNSPLEKIETIYLDYQSKTSVQLIQILSKYYWKINPKFKEGELGYEKNIEKNAAALVIGDRTIELFGRYSYVYDLSEAWLDFCGLGFIFALWVASKPLPTEMIKILETAFKNGLELIDEVVDENKIFNNPYFSVEKYLKENIHYELEPIQFRGLEKFRELVSSNLYESII